MIAQYRFWVLVIVALALAGCKSNSTSTRPDQEYVTVQAPLDRLIAGNKRFMDMQATHANQNAERRTEVAAGQEPFAIIVGCSDSRVPPEIVFDQGLGDLFVVRLAGNVVDTDALGSIEYAADHLHVPLVVVLGHDKCGAVQAAVDASTSEGTVPGNVASIIAAIKPAVIEAQGESGNLLDNAIDANIRRVVNQIRNSEPGLKDEVAAGKLKVVGARYKLDTGEVEFFSW
jgi:carbonic anhydrase